MRPAHRLGHGEGDGVEAEEGREHEGRADLVEQGVKLGVGVAGGDVVSEGNIGIRNAR